MDLREIYKSDISDREWIVYDIGGNLGWVLYFAGSYLAGGSAEGLFAAIVELLSALAILVGLIELICERVKKLDRVLPRYRVLLGFGALVLGGVLGCVAGVLRLEDGGFSVGGVLMTVGGALCSVFALQLYRRYQPLAD